MALEVLNFSGGDADLPDVVVLGSDLGNKNTSNLTTYDFTVSVTQGTTNAALVALITYELAGGVAGYVSSVTFDPSGLNLPMRGLGGTPNLWDVGADFFGMRLPSTVTTGSYTVRVVLDTGHDSCHLSVVSLDNVRSPEEPWDWNFAQNASQSSEIVSSVFCPAGGILFFIGHHASGSSTASFSTATERVDTASEHHHSIAYDVLPNGRSSPQTETITWSSSSDSGLVFFSLR